MTQELLLQLLPLMILSGAIGGALNYAFKIQRERNKQGIVESKHPFSELFLDMFIGSGVGCVFWLITSGMDNLAFQIGVTILVGMASTRTVEILLRMQGLEAERNEAIRFIAGEDDQLNAAKNRIQELESELRNMQEKDIAQKQLLDAYKNLSEPGTKASNRLANQEDDGEDDDQSRRKK